MQRDASLRRSGRPSVATRLATLRVAMTCFVLTLSIIYLSFLYSFASVMRNQGNVETSNSDSNNNDAKLRSVSTVNRDSSASGTPHTYTEWRKLATDLAKLPPSELLDTLQRQDPFGVRAIEHAIRNAPKERTLEELLPDIETVFTCPPVEERLSFPDQRDADKAQSYRNHDEGTFIFFQHLRKAGGTNVCSLATANLPKKHLPPYYCMPDYYWHHANENIQSGTNGCAGCLHHWSNQEIMEKIGRYWIAGNEWDSFDPTRHLDLPAVFVTSFRRPLDRAVSQFRFECLENRGCKFKEIELWWEHRRDLYNVYTWTFADVRQQSRLATSTNTKDIQKRSEAVGVALDVIMQFHVIMVMEYLRFASPLVEHVLGFTDTSVLTHHVRPHNGQIQRQDSLIPKEYLSAEQYKRMSETLALDEILTDAAQRLFWERLLCKTY